LDTIIEDIDTELLDLNSTINGLTLNNISGTLSINKGGTGQTSGYGALGTEGLSTYSSSSASSITTGSRSDGSWTLRRYGHLVFFSCRLICGGSTGYSPNKTIPSGYRPDTQLRISVTLRASQSTNGYGDMIINSNGTINLYTSTSSDAEVCCDTIWWTN
jgi:hypothetical protein